MKVVKVARRSCVLTAKGLHEQTRLLQLSKQREHELESMREAMQETLMNHKREVLMEVVSASSKAQHPVHMLSHSLGALTQPAQSGVYEPSSRACSRGG